MTSYELITLVDTFLKSIPPDGYLFSTLKRISDTYDKLVEPLSVLVVSPSQTIQERGAEVKHFLTQVSDELKKSVRARKLFTEIDNLELSLKSLHESTYIEDTQPLAQLTHELNQFAIAYEDFLRAYNSLATFTLLKRANTLFPSLTITLRILHVMKQNLVVPELESDESAESIMSLLLHPHDELPVLVSKLDALDKIYNELCRLFDVSTSQYPVRVIKVESGSLWTKIFGERQIIKLMTDLIRSGVQFLHRNYTEEGQLSMIPKKIEALDANMLLEQRLRERGFNTTDMREDIQKAGAVIAKQSNILLGGEAVVTINRETYSVGSMVDKMLLEQARTPLLEDGGVDENRLLEEGDPDTSKDS
jgi:hypothetical protein